MALYTLKSRDEALLPLANYNGDNTWVRNQMSSLGYAPTPAQTQVYSALGRTTGAEGNGGSNFFEKRGRSIENALGTTGASIASAFDTARENDLIEKRSKDANKSIEDIIRNAGYNSKDEFYDASDKAEREIFGKYGFDSDEYWNKHASMWSPAKANDKDVLALEATRQDVINRMNQEDADTIRKFDAIQDQLKNQSKTNADIADKAARDWKDYRENSYVGQKVNQDRGKFLGSAINTLSTGVDIAGLSANPLSNAIQGGAEGIADELEQNGFENFDWGRAGQNAAIGATTGAVTGALNKGISNSLAKNGGNLFKGGNALTRGLNNLGSRTALGRVGSTIATGAARGAVSGAVGGATGAGLQSANMAISKTPGVGKFYNELQNAKTNWDQSGSNFDERLTNTLTSGDSAVGDWLMNKRQSNVLGAAGNIGNRIQDVSDTYRTVDPLGNRKEYTPDQVRQLIDEYENYKAPEVLSSNSTDEVTDAMGEAGVTLSEIFRNRNGGQFNPYSRADGEAFNKWVQQTKADLNTPTTAPDSVGEYSKIQTSELNNLVDEIEAEYSKLYERGNAASDSISASNDLYDKAVKYKNVRNLITDLVGVRNDYYASDREAAALINVLERNGYINGNGRPTAALNSALKNAAPTTAKGWAKKAKQRIVEDINNSNLGNRVKDVSSDMPEDIRNMQIRDYNVSQNKNGPTPSGLDKVTKAFDESANQRVLTNRDGKDFALGEFGSNNLQRKVNAQHNLSEADIKNIIDTSDRQSISGDSSFRKDNVAWFGDLPNGERGTVITRLNSLGQEEVINAYKNNPGYEAELLKTYGTPAQSRTGNLGLEDLGDESAAQGRSSIIQQNRQNVNLTDPWDRVAQEAGYSNYDEVLQRYAEANPNAKINPRGMAGQVLTWMDQNPNTPTTASGWAKRARQRAVEDINNSNLGLKVQDVSQDDPSKQLYNALAGNRQPVAETEVETEADMGVVPSRTSKESKMRYAQGKELLAQYGTVDQPMARASRAVESVQEIADAGFTKPEDVEKMANVVTGSNGEVSKLTRNLIKNAAPVDTFTGDNGQTIEDFIDNSIELNSLYGTSAGAAAKRTIEANMRSLPSRAAGSVSYTDNPEDVFKVVQNLEASAAELEGRGGSTYHRPTIENIHQAKVLKDTANMLKDRLYDGVDVKQALTPEVADNLKSYDPKNKAWADYVDNKIMGAESIGDLRSAQAPWVRMSKHIDNAYTQAATVGGRMASNASDLSRILTTRNGLLKAGIDTVWNSNAARRGRAAVYDKLADRAADKAANTPDTAAGWAKQARQRAAEDLGKTNLGNRIQDVSGQPVNPQVATSAELANTVADYNPSTQLYNAIGRTEGALAQEAPAQYLANAAQEAEIVSPMEAPTAPANDIATSMGNTSTATYNALTGTPTTAQQANTGSINTGYYQPTGDYWTDIIASAMSAAIDANDVNAFTTLYGMYQDQMANVSKASSKEKDYSNPTNWSSADRTKLLSAQNAMGQIDQLEEAYNQATGGEGGNAIQGWLRSRASDISGGNWDPSAANYNSLSESVGMGIVKNLINLGVTEADAQRYLKYLPALTDTKEQAAQKLDTLRGIYQNQINNLYGAYGL